MEKRALIVALALVVPLALYGVPYAAASTGSTYAVYTTLNVVGPGTVQGTAMCNAGDYATGGGYGLIGGGSQVRDFSPAIDSAGDSPSTGQTPTGYFLQVTTSSSADVEFQLWAVCQSPITVAGLGVPQFGSLYVAIVLGALVYFALSRRYSRKAPALPTATAPV